MNDPDLSGNKTVFRPSPLQALKSGGQPVAPPPAPPPPVAAPITSPPPIAPVTRGPARWQTVLTIAFVVVAVLALGYVVLRLTHRPTGASPVRTSRIDPAARPGAAPSLAGAVA